MERSHMTQRILDLTLEIIYLLTGESYIAFKLSDGVMTPNCKSTQHPGVEPSPLSLISARNDDKNFLEVTKKLIELLTGEVPIRCQDVAVYLSVEEREYLEGHGDLYKAAMMEDQPPLTSPDGFKNTNSLEPCPDLPYSRKQHSSSHHYKAEEQIDIKLEDAAEECTDMRYDGYWKETQSPPPIISENPPRKNLPERHPRTQSVDCSRLQCCSDQLLDSNIEHTIEDVCVDPKELSVEEISPRMRDGSGTINPSNNCPTPSPFQSSSQAQQIAPHHYGLGVNTDDEETCVKGGKWCAEKENPPEMSADGSIMRNSPPYYAQYATRAEHHQCYQDVIKVEDTDEDDVYERDDHPCPDRKVPTDGHYGVSHSETCPVTTQAEEIEDDNIPDFPGETFLPVFNSAEQLVDGVRFPGPVRSVLDPAASWMDLAAPCYELNDTSRTLQGAKKPFSCINCGKSFKHKSKLETHERTHNGHRPYACSVCEKRFTQKAHLDTHNRIHTGEKPFVCLTCGRNFRDRSNLITHQRTHTGLRPYSCLRCGKRFRRKMHQKEHMCDHLTHQLQ